jgi:hypothetical protein
MTIQSFQQCRRTGFGRWTSVPVVEIVRDNLANPSAA